MKTFLLCTVLVLAGCAAQSTTATHPGSVNAFDSNSYDSLLIAHSVIDTTKTDLMNNVFSAKAAPLVKTALNNLITAYDAADTAYMAYHAAAVAGTATAAQTSAVTTGLANINSATSALTTAKASN